MADHIALGKEMAELNHRLVVLSVRIACLIGKSSRAARSVAMAGDKLAQARSDMEDRMVGEHSELGQGYDRDFTTIYYPGINREVEPR
jgi:hypothetical protein